MTPAMLASNLWKVTYVYITRGAIVHIPILTLYFQENGLSLLQVFYIHSVFSITKFIVEVPSGYISDNWGRKNTIVAGGTLKALGMLCYCIGDAMPWFIAAVILLAIGSSFLSGTLEAVTYDTMLALGTEDEYRKIAGKQRYYQFMTEGIGALVASPLVVYGLRAPMWVTLCFFISAPLVALTLRDPPIHKASEELRHWVQIKRISYFAFIKNALIRYILLLDAFIVTIALCVFWLVQPYQVELGLPITLFGVFHALTLVCHAFASRFAHVLTTWYDDRLLLAGICAGFTMALVILGTNTTLWALSALVLVRTLWGFTTPVVHDIINQHTSSDMRATVLSLAPFVAFLLFAIASPVLGYIADVYTIKQAFVIGGITGGLAMAVTLAGMYSTWRRPVAVAT